MSKQTRELILKHILAEARQFGLRKVRIRYVARSASLSLTALYYYFPKKEDALIAAIEFASDDYFSELKRILKKRDPKLKNQLIQIVRLRCSFFLKFFNYDFLKPQSGLFSIKARRRISALLAKERKEVLPLIVKTELNSSAVCEGEKIPSRHCLVKVTKRLRNQLILGHMLSRKLVSAIIHEPINQ